MTAAPPDASDSPAQGSPRRSVREVLAALRRPKVAVMAALGFSSGLPFLLIGNTLGYWLREDGVKLAAIGFLSWAGLAYSFKFIWGAVVDRAPPPLWGRLGRRRGWMLWCQLFVGLGLVGMALTGPLAGAPLRLVSLAVAAIVVGVAAASQDVVIDAWRIESAADADELGLLTSAYSLTYRIAIIATDAVILWVAASLGWNASYALYGALMAVGVAATFFAREPARADAAIAAKEARASALSPRGLYDIVVEPFVSFFRAHGWVAALILAMITLYHLSDYLRGPILNPYYVDLGFTKPVVAGVRASFGLASIFVGVAAGGLAALRLGYMRALIIGGVIQPIAIALFAMLAWTGPNVPLFTAIMSFDGFAMSFAGVALTAYMSTLTSIGYTATQYALLTSALAWTGKFLKGFSGEWVQNLAAGGLPLVQAYAFFYLIAAAVGAPALALVLWLAAVDRRRRRGQVVADAQAPAPGVA